MHINERVVKLGTPSLDALQSQPSAMGEDAPTLVWNSNVYKC